MSALSAEDDHDDILLHVLGVGNGMIAIVERKKDSDSQYFLYDDGAGNVHQYHENLSNSLQVLGSNKLSGIVITHVNVDCTLINKLPRRYIRTKVLSSNPYSYFSNCQVLLHDSQIDYNPNSVLCTQSFFENCFKFFYIRGKPPCLYDLSANGNVENQLQGGAAQSTPLKDRPLMLRIEENDFAVQFTGKTARIDQMFCNANIFQVPYHTCIKPKLSRADLKRFPDERHIENAARLLALYQCKDLLAAEIDKLAKNHVLYKKSIAFQAYFYGKETKDSHNENKFEKGFRKMFLTHDRLANDPDDCFTIDNPQLSWYNSDSGKVFSSETRNAVEQERKNQLKTIRFICDCVKWAYFYQNINADLYFASTGPESMEPDVFQALIGIAIACRKRKTKCRIVITSIAAFMSVSQFFIKSLRDYISSCTDIWYLNNFDCSKPIQVRQHTFFTICSSFQQGARLKDQKPTDLPKVIYNPMDSMGIHVEGMTALRLSEIRTNQDFHVTSLSSMKINIFLNSPTQKFKLHPDKRQYLLGQYLNSIGHPNPYGLINVEELLECVVGSGIISQLKNLQNSKHLNLKIILALLSSKVKGQSEFALNSTQTAATSAFVNVRNCSVRIADKTMNVYNIHFIVRNAKTSKMTLTLDSSLTKEPINLLQWLQSNIRCIGITLAEHLVFYDPKGFFWPSARQQTLGRILTIILGKFEALTILQNIPMFLSHVIASCNVKHYLSYYSFDEKSILLEAYIHINPPDESIILLDNIELRLLSSFSVHLIPKEETHEMIIRLQGTGIVNGEDVILKYSNLLIPSHVEIVFASKCLPLDIFSHLGENPPPDYCLSSFQENEKCYTKLICCQTAPGLKQPAIILSFQKDDIIDSWRGLLPCSIPQLKNVHSYVTIQSFNSIKPIAVTAADFLVVLNNYDKKTSIDLHFSLQCDEAKRSRCHISISPLASLTGKEVLQVIELTCGSIGRDFISDLTLLPVLHQIISSLSLINLSCSICDGEVEAIKLSAIAPEILLLCQPVLSCRNVSLSICYDTHKKLNVQLKGKLVLQLEFQENVREYSFNGNCVLASDNKRWLLSFDLFENLTLDNLIEGFGWSSSNFLANPILSTVYSMPVKFMRLEIISLPKGSHINKAELSIYLEHLDIGLVTLTHTNLTVKIQTDNEVQEEICFELNAMIGEYLHIKLEYVPENNLKEGEVTVSDFQSVAAPVALNVFNLECLDQSFINLKLVLENCFMNIFDNKFHIQSGTVDFMKLKIHIPLKKHDTFTLKYIELRVKDYVALGHCIVDCIQFEYSKSSFPGTNECLARITGIITNTTAEEMIDVTIDVTNINSVPSALIANVKPIVSKHSLHLKTVIQLSGCKEPTLPKVNLPRILDLPLTSGTMFFSSNYPLRVIGFDIAAVIPSWDIFSDPVFNVHDLIVRAVWNHEYPVAKLIFDDCTLLFRDFELNVGGEILPDKVQMKCKGSSLPPDQLFFKHLLQDLTPKACICPIIPCDINLPALSIDNVAIDVDLREMLRKFSFNGYIPFSTSWTFNFGDNEVVIDNVGGALEWAINQNSLSYIAKLHGDLHLGMINVSMQMILGRNIDSIITATVQNLQYGWVADYLAYQCTQDDQTEPTLNSLVPANLQGVTPFMATLALNITRKQLILCGSVVDWGMGTLFVGYLSDQSQMDYTVMIDVNSSFSFSKCSDSLAFIDDYVSVRSAKLVVSSVDLSKLSTVINAFEGSHHGNMTNPFSTIRKNNEMCADEIRKGTTLYAVLNVDQSKSGTLANIFELGDQSLASSEIIIKVSFDLSHYFQVFAFIERILLFGMLEFKKIKLKYTLERKQENNSYDYFLELEGRILFHLDMTVDDSKSISFDGKLSVSPVEATFEASTIGELINRPAGLNICVKKLTLQFTYLLGKQKSFPEICIEGYTEIGKVGLICRLLLKGSSFKVIEIILTSGLSLTALFSCSNVDWSATSLNIGIVRGRFYYAREETSFTTIDKKPIQYLSGYNGEMVVTIFNWDFEIKVSIPHDRSSLMFLGSSLRPIDLGFAMLTGTGSNRHIGPGVRYTNKKLSLLVGVTMFKQNFEGEFSYLTDKKAFEGSICYLGRFLWMENPKLGIRWSKENGIEITHFPLLPGGAFEFLSAMARYAKVLFSLVCGSISWEMELDLTTGKNPDPDRYLVKLILSGNITVSVAGIITLLVIPLPEIPLRILKVDDFSLSKLPQFLIRCLWESAGDIFRSLLRYIDPIEIAKRMGKAIIDGVVRTIKNVVNVVKKVAKKAWKCFKSWFGFSAFIVDSETKAILGYIYAGKNGRELHNIKYTVNNFGAFLAANTIKEVAKDVHMTATACMHLNDMHIIENLNELKQQTNELSVKLNLAADDILCVTYISLNFNDSQAMYLQWQVGNDEGEQYSEDEGDIEYTMKIVAITVKHDQVLGLKVQTKEIFCDFVTPEKITEVIPIISQAEQEHTDSEMKSMESDNTLSKSDSVVEPADATSPDLSHADDSTDDSKTPDSQAGELELEDKEERNNVTEDEHSINDTQTKQVVKLSALVPIEQNVMDNAILISISLQPTVTLRVKTLPPENPMVESMDEYWMADIKKTINETGREKEVTLFGKRGFVKHFPRQVELESTENEMGVTAEFNYSDEDKLIVIEGKIQSKFNTVAKYYLVHIFDTSDESIIVKELLIPSVLLSEESSETVNEVGMTEFKLCLDPFKLPYNSPGPYAVAVTALTNDFICLHHQAANISGFDLSRCDSPVNPNIVLPNRSASDDSTCVCVSWDFTEIDGEETELNYEFMILLKCAVTSEKNTRTAEEIDTSCLSKSESDGEQVEFIDTKTITFDEARKASSKQGGKDNSCGSYSFVFDLKELYLKYKIPLDSGMNVKCEVLTVCENNEKLPSLPLSQEFIVVSPPSNFKLCSSDSNAHKPGIFASWRNTSHAISYQVDVVCDNDTKKKKYSKQHRPSSKMDFKSLTKSQAHFDLKDFQNLPSTIIQTYKLCVYALGFGEDLLKSLVPTLAKQQVVVLPVKLMYNPADDAVTVTFTPSSHTLEYTVALYQYNNTYSLLCEKPISVMEMSSCEFDVPRLRNMGLKDGNVVTACVYPTTKDNSNIIYFGVSNNCYNISRPDRLSINAKYRRNWVISDVSISWCPTNKGQWYEYGIQSLDGQIIQSNFTFKTDAVISSQFMKPSSSILFQMFVRSNSNGNGFLNSDVTSHEATVFQCIVTEDGECVLFTSVSLVKECNILTFNIIANCLLPVYQNRLYPKGTPFSNHWFSSRILNKFLCCKGYMSGIFRSYCYAFDLLDGRKKGKNEWKDLRPLKIICPQKWHSRIHILAFIRCRRVKRMNRAWNKVEFSFAIKIYTVTKAPTSQDTKKKTKQIEPLHHQTGLEEQETYEHIPEEAVENVQGIENVVMEGASESYMKKGKNFFKKVIQKGSEGVRSLLNLEPSKQTLFEHSSKGQFLSVSDKGLDRKGQVAVDKLQEVYLVRIADIDKLHSIDFKISTKLCIIEEAHLFVTYV